MIHQSFPFVPRFIVRVNILTPCVLREGHFSLVVKISYWGTTKPDGKQGIDGTLSVGKAPIHGIELTANKVN